MSRFQLPLYFLALAVGLSISTLIEVPSETDALVWIALALLLYTTFCHVHPSEAARIRGEHRFLTAVLFGNFVAVPFLVWAMTSAAPLEPAVRLGVLMVLLVPCTDWFITFARLGRGNTALAIGITPVLLFVQLPLLPLYLWLFLGREYADVLRLGPFLTAFLGLIAIPFVLAYLTQVWAERDAFGARWWRSASSLTAPFLALVILLIAASNGKDALAAADELAWSVLIFAAYLGLAALLARVLSARAKLDNPAARTLAFSFGTRNSFVVLPMALALPGGWELTASVIVVQSFVELTGMLGFLWFVPRRLMPG